MGQKRCVIDLRSSQHGTFADSLGKNSVSRLTSLLAKRSSLLREGVALPSPASPAPSVPQECKQGGKDSVFVCVMILPNANKMV
ncbi:hypothetical protein E2C01_067943 [Portunus trituberculatus]|uniref:Uncharacterized protein n=1 Tax=Portunus trituberculatus TaxID=210409 RepID=A0A5B7HY59_PORTR|nr:hypothetical protein [Portunus trituberculatus]